MKKGLGIKTWQLPRAKFKFCSNQIRLLKIQKNLLIQITKETKLIVLEHFDKDDNLLVDKTTMV